MNKLNFLTRFLLSIILFLNISCKSESDQKVQEIRNEKLYVNDEITIKAQYTTQGILINTPVYVTHEIKYYNGVVTKEISTSKSGGITMVVTQEFDEKQRLKKLISEQNGEQSVIQINKYTDDNLLLSELRIEKNGNMLDTILYEYHYPDNRANPMNYYRTNNGKKVTEMKLSKTDKTEILEERAYGSENYVGINTTTRILNDNGKVLEERQVNISSDWNDKTKLDTSIYEPIFYEYDNFGRIIRQESENPLSINGILENHYDDQGILEKKIIIKKGQPKKIIKYKKV